MLCCISGLYSCNFSKFSPFIMFLSVHKSYFISSHFFYFLKILHDQLFSLHLQLIIVLFLDINFNILFSSWSLSMFFCLQFWRLILILLLADGGSIFPSVSVSYSCFLRIMEWGNWRLFLRFLYQLWDSHLPICLPTLSLVERNS